MANPPTTAYRGRDSLLKVSNDGGSTYTMVGGARTTGFTYNNNPVDITNALSAGNKEWLADAGEKETSVTLDGVITNDAMQIVLETQARDRTLLPYRISWAGAGSMAGLFLVQTFTLTGTYNGAQTFTCSLVGSGAITYAPG